MLHWVITMETVTRATALETFGRYRHLIPDFSDFLDALVGELPTSLRINTLLANPRDVVRSLRLKGIDLQPTPLGETFWEAPEESHPGRLLEHLMGLIYTQALGSGLPPMVLAPQPGESVLDLCAAPGSKTTQMAQHMENRGAIIANEPVQARHPSLHGNLRRLGVANTVVTAYDGQNFPKRWRFSKVLVDAPCSGEGNARIGPNGELRGHRRRRRDLSGVQKALLLRAFDVTADDGQLVYSTCTYDPLENEAVVDALLKARPARIMPIFLDIPHDPGVTWWQDGRYDEQIQEAWRIYPHRVRTVGFFLARIARR